MCSMFSELLTESSAHACRYITSDSGAVRDISGAHKFKNMTPEEGTAAALQAGCDINSGGQYAQYVEKAVKDGLVNESVVDDALMHAFKTRIRLVGVTAIW